MANKQKGEFSFYDLNKEMSKNSKWGGLMSEDAGVSEITDYIPVGNYACNASLSGSIFGGIPNNRITALSGVSGVGKTYLLLNIAREAIEKDYFVIWYDSENAVEKKMLIQFGINPEKFRYEPVTSVEEFRTSITQIIELLIEKKESGMEIPKVFFVLDSLGGLPTEKEIDDAKSGSDKADMTKAKKLRSLFRIVSMKMGIIGATMALSNHVYESTNTYIPTSVQSGGCLVGGSKVIMSNGELKNIEDIRVGDKVKTIVGNKEIMNTWKFKKDTLDIEFEDGSKITCSKDHRFFIGENVDDILDDSKWIKASDLVEGDEIKKM